jgi:hypothetical protein
VLKLSIIVPADGAQQDLDNTLVAVLENRPAHCEIVVPHADTYRDPYDLSDEVRFVASPDATLVSLVNAGIRASQGEIVHVLGAGTIATPNWTDPVLARFEQTQDLAAVAPLLMDAQRPDRIAAAGVRYATGGDKRWVGYGARVSTRPRRYRIDGPALQAAFFRRKTLLKIGPFHDGYGSYHVDSDYAARLRLAGLGCEHVGESRLLTSLPKTPRGYRAGRQAEYLYRAHRDHFGAVGPRVAHAWHVTWTTLGSIPSPAALTTLCGRVHGALTRCPGAQMSATADEDVQADDVQTLRFETTQPATAEPQQIYGKTA